MQYRRGVLLFFEVIHQISRSHGLKSLWFESNLSKITRLVTAVKSLRFALFFSRFKFLSSLVPSVQLAISQHWFRQWLVAEAECRQAFHETAASSISFGFLAATDTVHWTFWVLTTVNVLYICVFSCFLLEIKLLLLLLLQPPPPPLPLNLWQPRWPSI